MWQINLPFNNTIFNNTDFTHRISSAYNTRQHLYNVNNVSDNVDDVNNESDVPSRFGGSTITGTIFYKAVDDNVDLTVSQVTSPRVIIIGESFQLSWTVINEGSGRAEVYPDFNDRDDNIYLSTDTTLDEDDILIGSSSGESLKGGESYTISKNYEITNNVDVDQDWYLLVATDANDNQRETNEENNVTAVQVDIKPVVDNIRAINEEFQVNTYTQNNQGFSAVAALTDGGFVVTWTSFGQDGDVFGGVYGQRFDNQGNKIGDEFQVNTYTQGLQYSSAVAALADGSFVVTWDSKPQFASDYGVYGQRFDNQGNKIGNEFQVNTYTQNWQISSEVAALTDRWWLCRYLEF